MIVLYFKPLYIVYHPIQKLQGSRNTNQRENNKTALKSCFISLLGYDGLANVQLLLTFYCNIVTTLSANQIGTPELLPVSTDSDPIEPIFLE